MPGWRPRGSRPIPSARQKQKISGILDKLCDGYEKQLDKLFQTDAMDITADIAVRAADAQKGRLDGR